MAWVCFLEEDLDHILGEAEAEVKGYAGQAGDAANEERVPDKSIPQPRVKDIPVPSGRLILKKKKKMMPVARPHL
ncbi:UNVERIFIED_CONTAM: hypothetical protein Sangu_1968800 [Sesamum angustifolium]|uniref:Uncharacterized protein n=1 Tax=Sesamum angustifolium TaxID=2727405 RepID=A0AAW2LWJ2_9LAMI